jgi:hypothetical protein
MDDENDLSDDDLVRMWEEADPTSVARSRVTLTTGREWVRVVTTSSTQED